MRRHGIDGTAVHFGVGLWPYDLLLRFGYDLPEHDYLWDGRWFDDRFESAALDVRATTSKLLLALPGMVTACDRLASIGDASAGVIRPAVEEAPLAVETVATYLGRLARDLAAVVPCCFGTDGRSMIDDRDSLTLLADSAALRKLDETLADLLRPPPALRNVIDAGWAAHLPEVYTIGAAAGDRPPLPGAAASALRASAQVTLDSARDVEDALRVACPWLDSVVDHLQSVVAARAEDGPGLLERWQQPDWSVMATRTPIGALARHLPRI